MADNMRLANNLIIIGIFIAGLYGWVMNIVSLIKDTGESLGFTIARAIGIVIPMLGAVLGYF